jgi:hypothetical protein
MGTGRTGMAQRPCGLRGGRIGVTRLLLTHVHTGTLIQAALRQLWSRVVNGYLLLTIDLTLLTWADSVLMIIG